MLQPRPSGRTRAAEPAALGAACCNELQKVPRRGAASSEGRAGRLLCKRTALHKVGRQPH
eukprot:1984106-Heterocapsa_arctica.AAC.1